MFVSKCDDLLSLIRRKCYSSHGAYSQSKLALVLFTYYLQEQMTAGGFPVIVNAVDPGMVDTALYDNLWSLAQAAKKPVAKILFRVTFIHLKYLLVLAFFVCFCF